MADTGNTSPAPAGNPSGVATDLTPPPPPGDTTVAGANGATENVPTSAVDLTGPSLAGTGNGTNPTTVQGPPQLSRQVANTSFSTGLSGFTTSEHRLQSSDMNEVKRVDTLMEVLKSLSDGSFDKKAHGMDSAVLGQLAKDAHLSPKDTAILNGHNPGFWQEVGGALQNVTNVKGITNPIDVHNQGGQLSPAGLRELKKVTVETVRTHMQSLGLNPAGASTYQTLQAQWGPENKNLAQQVQDGRGAIQPVEPLERVTGLMTMLKDLETGHDTSNVNPSVYAAMLAKAGVPGQGQDSVYGVLSGGALPPNLTKEHLENVVSDAIRTHMTDMQINPGSAQTYDELAGVSVPSHIKSQFGNEGFDLKNVTTWGSLAPAVQKQLTQGGGIPGGTQTVNTPNVSTLKGGQLVQWFQKQWTTNTAFRISAAATLNAAGLSDTTLSNQPNAANAAANLFVQAMNKTPAGQSVWGMINGLAKQGEGGRLYKDPAIAQVESEAHKIGANLTPEEANHIAALYGGSSLTGNVDALNAAVASYYQYDPHDNGGLGLPGSYAATAIDKIKNEYGAYGLKLSNEQAGAMVEDIMHQGGTDLSSIYSAGDAAVSYATERAKTAASALFPTLAPLIQEGQTLAGSGGLLGPYAQAYAQTLGTDVNSVDITDPKFISLVTQPAGGGAQTSPTGGGNPGSGGAPGTKQPGTSTASSTAGGLKSLDQFQAAIMQDPSTGWQHTENASTKYGQMANYLLGSMGFSPTATGSAPPTPNTGTQ